LRARRGSPRREDDSEEVTAQQVDDRVQVFAIDVEHGPLCGAGDARTTAVVTADIAAAYDRVLVTATGPASIAYITEEWPNTARRQSPHIQ
jgi:hypothetical protein